MLIGTVMRQKEKEGSKKRKRDDDLNQGLPNGPNKETEVTGNLDFNEELDEEVRLLDIPRML